MLASGGRYRRALRRLLARSKRGAACIEEAETARGRQWGGGGGRYVDKSIQPVGEKGQGIINWLLCVAVIGEAKLRTTIHPFPGAGRLSSRLALASILSRLVSDRFQFLPSPSPPVPVFLVENVANGPETLLGTAIFSPRGHTPVNRRTISAG